VGGRIRGGGSAEAAGVRDSVARERHGERVVFPVDREGWYVYLHFSFFFSFLSTLCKYIPCLDGWESLLSRAGKYMVKRRSSGVFGLKGVKGERRLENRAGRDLSRWNVPE
jgi:hypothetical protein